jgi:hypothetical protein
MFYTLNKNPTTNEAILPYVIISKVTLAVGPSILDNTTDLLSAVDGITVPAPSNSTYRPLEIQVDLVCRDLSCKKDPLNNSIFLNDKLRKKLKIYLKETINGFSRVEVFQVDSKFNAKDFQNRNNSYTLKHKSQISFLQPDELKYEAWIEMDDRTEDSEDLNNLSFYPNSYARSGVKNKETIIEGGKLKKLVGFSYTTSYDSGHSHEIKSESFNNSGYTSYHTHNNRKHRHVITDGNVEVAGEFPHSHKLVPIISIVDKRRMFYLEESKIQTIVPENTLISQQYKNIYPGKGIVKADPINGFTPIWFSRSNTGANNFLFGINMRRLMEKHSLFNRIAIKPSSYNELIRKSPPLIYSMEVFRKRVKGSTETSSRPIKKTNSQFITPSFGSKKENEIESFDDQKEKEILCMTQQLRGSNVVMTQNYTNQASFGNFRGSAVEEIALSFNSGDRFRFFGFSDNNIRAKTDGFYEYSVRLKIRDPSIEVFQMQLRELINSKKVLSEFLNNVMKVNLPSRQPFQVPGANPTNSHQKTFRDKSPPLSEFTVQTGKDIDQIYRQGGFYKDTQNVTGPNTGKAPMLSQKDEYVPGNFNAYTNSFEPSFQKTTSFGVGERGFKITEELKSSLRSYLRILSFFSDNDLPIEQELKILSNFISPFAGSPGGIREVISMMDKLEKQIKSFIDLAGLPMTKHSDSTIDSLPQKSHVGAGTRNRMPVFIVEHTFSDFFNAGIPKEIGIDFLSIEASNIGLKQLTKEQFMKSMDFENNKHFIDKRTDLSIPGRNDNDTSETTKLTYVTPNEIRINPTLNLKNVGNKPSFGRKETYEDIATITALSNKGMEIRTKTSSLIDFSTNKIEQDKKKNNFNKTQKAYTKSEENKIKNGISLDTEIKIANKLAESFAITQGITVVNPFKTGNKDDKGKEVSSDAEVDKTKSYLNNDLGAASTTLQNRSASPILKQLLKMDNPKKEMRTQDYNLNSGDSIIKRQFDEWTKTGISPEQELKDAPNVVKILFKNNQNVTRDTNSSFQIKEELSNLLSEGINKNNRDVFRFKFETISRIEVLVGFGTTSKKTLTNYDFTQTQLSMPRWKPMTKEILNKFKSGNMLCRLTPYESKTFNIKRDKTYDLPIYDEYFIIRSS